MAVRVCYESRGVRCEYTGAVNISDLFRAVVDFTSLPDLENIRYVIHDLRGISSFSSDDATMRTIAERIKGLGRDNPVVMAAVVTQRADVTAVVADFCRYTGRTVLIFPELADALQWVAGGLRAALPNTSTVH